MPKFQANTFRKQIICKGLIWSDFFFALKGESDRREGEEGKKERKTEENDHFCTIHSYAYCQI